MDKNSISIFIFSFCILTFFLCIVSLIRNGMVHKFRSIAIDTISRIHQEAIDTTNNYVSCFDLLEDPSYNQMLFDFTKWSYEAFYPKLEFEVRERQKLSD